MSVSLSMDSLEMGCVDLRQFVDINAPGFMQETVISQVRCYLTCQQYEANL